MQRFLTGAACLGLLTTLGCAMCANPHDCKYGVYGGKRERANHARGRLASVFDPAEEVRAASDSGPTPADNLEPMPRADQPGELPRGMGPADDGQNTEPIPADASTAAEDGPGAGEEFDPLPEESGLSPLDESLPEFPADDATDLPDLDL